MSQLSTAKTSLMKEFKWKYCASYFPILFRHEIKYFYFTSFAIKKSFAISIKVKPSILVWPLWPCILTTVNLRISKWTCSLTLESAVKREHKDLTTLINPWVLWFSSFWKKVKHKLDIYGSFEKWYKGDTSVVVLRGCRG